MLQSKALAAQQQAVASAVAAAEEASKQWLARLKGMEQLLYSAQSAQFLDIRKREAEAYKVCLHGADQHAHLASLAWPAYVWLPASCTAVRQQYGVCHIL